MIYDLLGIELPEVVKGHPQTPLEGRVGEAGEALLVGDMARRAIVATRQPLA
jgi:hypothetical protein